MKKALLGANGLHQAFDETEEEKWFIGTVDTRTKNHVLSLLENHLKKYRERSCAAFDGKLLHGYYVPRDVLETLLLKKQTSDLHFKALHLKDVRWREWKKQK